MATIDEQIAKAKRDLEELERRKTLTFPQEIEIHAYASRDHLYDDGEKIGLSGEALRMFAHAEQYIIICRVDSDGMVTPLRLKE